MIMTGVTFCLLLRQGAFDGVFLQGFKKAHNAHSTPSTEVLFVLITKHTSTHSLKGLAASNLLYISWIHNRKGIASVSIHKHKLNIDFGLLL